MFEDIHQIKFGIWQPCFLNPISVNKCKTSPLCFLLDYYFEPNLLLQPSSSPVCPRNLPTIFSHLIWNLWILFFGFCWYFCKSCPSIVSRDYQPTQRRLPYQSTFEETLNRFSFNHETEESKNSSTVTQIDAKLHLKSATSQIFSTNK